MITRRRHIEPKYNHEPSDFKKSSHIFQAKLVFNVIVKQFRVNNSTNTAMEYKNHQVVCPSQHYLGTAACENGPPIICMTNQQTKAMSQGNYRPFKLKRKVPYLFYDTEGNRTNKQARV